MEVENEDAVRHPRERERFDVPVAPGGLAPVDRLLWLSEEELAAVDPLVMNLAVAKGLPCFAGLEIDGYAHAADEWAADIRRRLPGAEGKFRRSPADWKNDIRFFRLGMVCWYVDTVLRVTYPDELAEAGDQLYADPENVFLNGLMERRRDSSASMPVLHVALAWRLGWPVSLACAGTHLFCRYDDGEVTHNIEATTFGRGGFRSHPDEYYRRQFGIPSIAVSCGSDLRSVSAREMLALFIAIRGFHFAAVGRIREAERDLLLARHGFPRNRVLYRSQMEASLQCGLRLFHAGEDGHPAKVGSRLGCLFPLQYSQFCTTVTTMETLHANDNVTAENQEVAMH